ncbi:MAG: tRNA adenosine(34) deaminase TadA [Mariprofundales bacterium]
MDKEYMHYHMLAALAQAKIAATKGEVPVGAVLITQDAHVFSAHNNPIATNDCSSHAEILVLRQACVQQGNYRLAGATLFVTLEPCCMCAGAMLHARIQHLVYGTNDPKTGAVRSLYQLLEDSRFNHQIAVQSGILADDCSQVLRNFFAARRKKRSLRQ